MIRRLVAVAAWLLAGHAVLAGVYWGLLNVPESSGPMLTLSAMLAALIAAGAAGLYAGALLAWDRSSPAWRALLAGFRRFYRVLPAAVLFAATWWLSVRLRAWHAGARGAIDATIMLKLGWHDAPLLHEAVDDLLAALHWVAGLSLALGLLAAALVDGVRGLGTRAWLTRSLDPRTLLLIAAIELVFVILPWHHVYWRPHGLSIGAEPAFVSVKLGVLGCLAGLGAALIAWTAMRARRGWRSGAPQRT